MAWTNFLGKSKPKSDYVLPLTAREITRMVWGDHDRPDSNRFVEWMDRLMLDEGKVRKTGLRDDPSEIRKRLSKAGLSDTEIATVRRDVAESFHDALNSAVGSGQLRKEWVSEGDWSFAVFQAYGNASVEVREDINRRARALSEIKLNKHAFVAPPQPGDGQPELARDKDTVPRETIRRAAGGPKR